MGPRRIAQKYASLHPGIRLVRTEQFLTQVQNYNFALRQISEDSQYCKICQADDWLYPRCLTEMVAVGEQHPTTTIISSYSLQGSEVVSTGIVVADLVAVRSRSVSQVLPRRCVPSSGARRRCSTAPTSSVEHRRPLLRRGPAARGHRVGVRRPLRSPTWGSLTRSSAFSGSTRHRSRAPTRICSRRISTG